VDKFDNVKMGKVSVNQFLGIKNDGSEKQISADYFSDIVNFSFLDDSVLGLQKVLCPELIQTIGNSAIDGIFEYKFLNQFNILQTKIIVVSNGTIYETDFNTYSVLKSGLHKGKVSFAVYLDKLYISNGYDNIQVYYGNYGLISEMGSPVARNSNSLGNLSGTYKYALTYVTNGGEEIVGSISNSITVSNNEIKLYCPLGYDGVNSRKLYRTEANGQELKFLRDISDNTTTEIVDNIFDIYLGAEIGQTNNELPKPYFLAVAGNRLYATKVDKYPTQLFTTDVNFEVIDSASYIDVSNFGSDNTEVMGIGEDFNKIIVGTRKNIFFVNPEDNSVVLTRANVGFLDGYSIAKCPSFNNFSGGLMFASSQKDIRLMSGLQALPVSTSLDNITTQNYSQNLQGSLPNDLISYSSISATFYNYKYLLQIDSIRYVFDIRNSAWTKEEIRTENYISQPNILAVINNRLLNGQIDGKIEEEYKSIKYRNEDCPAYLKSVEIQASTEFKFIEKLYFWFTTTEDNELKISVVSDSNRNYKSEKDFDVIDGAFNEDFNANEFNENKNGMDYRVYNIYKPCRWLKYNLEVSKGNISFEAFEISGQQISNKE